MNDSTSGAPAELTYEQFGHNFIHLVVTPARIERELRALLHEPIKGEVALPAELLRAKYQFTLTDIKIDTRPECEPLLGLRQSIHGELALKVGLLGLGMLGLKLRFTLRITIHIDQIVRTYQPLILKLETRLVDGDSIEIEVDPHNVPSDILDRLTIIERAVRSEVVNQVNRRIGSGRIAQALTIDLRRIAEEARVGSRREG